MVQTKECQDDNGSDGLYDTNEGIAAAQEVPKTLTFMSAPYNDVLFKSFVIKPPHFVKRTHI